MSAVPYVTPNAAVPPVRVTVKVSSLVPLSPSVTATSSIDTEPATVTTAGFRSSAAVLVWPSENVTDSMPMKVSTPAVPERIRLFAAPDAV